ncbi:MAG: outer membrane beta-barrel protein [Hyphomicrobiales bacterium]|nr:outer membrane beta-barrel protein [Hyphomicrobiales bacterium]
MREAVLRFCAATLALLAGAAAARAETQISVYGGLNENFKSQGTLSKGTLTDTRDFDWQGKSFEMPPYWGVRATHWFGNMSNWGIALDYVHSKAYANVNFATDPVYSHLEFTDGNNIVTLNAMYRFQPVWNGQGVPYVGVGAGVAIPHVEVWLKAFPTQNTWEYQLAGGAAQVLGGLEYKFDRNWSAFAEARLMYSHLATDLNGGGQFKTYLWSPAFSLGLSYRFNN